MNVKNAKITEPSYTYKDYACTYADILNSFNPKLQLKNTEPTITIKLKDLVSELRGFKIMTILVIEF